MKLHLRSQCSDAVLATVAASCPLLRQIDISRSEQVRCSTCSEQVETFCKGWLQLVTGQVTDSGLKHLHSCSSLVSVNVLKCWALTPAGVGGSTNLIFQRHCSSLTVHLLQYVYVGLLLALPHIRLLFFANMTAVMEEISKDEKEPAGPFFLEHFDNSDYSLAMPEDGVSSHNTDFLNKNFLSRLVPLGWTASPPLPTSPPPFPTSPAAD